MKALSIVIAVNALFLILFVVGCSTFEQARAADSMSWTIRFLGWGLAASFMAHYLLVAVVMGKFDVCSLGWLFVWYTGYFALLFWAHDRATALIAERMTVPEQLVAFLLVGVLYSGFATFMGSIVREEGASNHRVTQWQARAGL